MRTLTVRIEGDAEFFSRSREAARRVDAGNGYQGENRSFETLSQLFETFTPKRWELLQKLQEIGPSSLRGLARALGRDVKRVHEDASLLLAEGIIERNAENLLFVPFDEIRIDVDLRKSAAA